ncbi:uncharacterized protein SRS1_10767 [Sporisorium reilianum f. sp. reilianum]|uniref:Uncharacterized protein n=1 Tax=Sporisorium reilianum f. sp. reilianum TaxID=72559 RepID=A0A2N8UDX7_9BASI|nr:uncharacterized protein SRS1_10767 [Sporisorium reilianum f. sp. reilianum]
MKTSFLLPCLVAFVAVTTSVSAAPRGAFFEEAAKDAGLKLSGAGKEIDPNDFGAAFSKLSIKTPANNLHTIKEDASKLPPTAKSRLRTTRMTRERTIDRAYKKRPSEDTSADERYRPARR